MKGSHHHHFLIAQLILLLLSKAAVVVVNSQSIQGYIYWDTNANGILDNGLDDSNNNDKKKSELENGIIDVTVQVHSCYSSNNNDDGKFLVTYLLFVYTLCCYSISYLTIHILSKIKQKQ